jgi:hypothetical protein
VNDVRHETNRSFRNRKREYLKNINEFETKSKNKNTRDLYRGINEFQKSYQPRTNLVKDENGDLFCRFSWYFEQMEESPLSATE